MDGSRSVGSCCQSASFSRAESPVDRMSVEDVTVEFQSSPVHTIPVVLVGIIAN